jgi:hypothetical protein
MERDLGQALGWPGAAGTGRAKGMTGWQRLKIVLSVIYWLAAIGISASIYATVRSSQQAEISVPLAPATSPPPASNTGQSDAEIWGPQAASPTQDEVLADYCRQRPANCPAPTSPLVFAGGVLAFAAVVYAIAAALWWAFAGFGRQRS